jgi:hypothetical protein
MFRYPGVKYNAISGKYGRSHLPSQPGESAHQNSEFKVR